MSTARRRRSGYTVPKIVPLSWDDADPPALWITPTGAYSTAAAARAQKRVGRLAYTLLRSHSVFGTKRLRDGILAQARAFDQVKEPSTCT